MAFINRILLLSGLTVVQGGLIHKTILSPEIEVIYVALRELSASDVDLGLVLEFCCFDW